MNITEAIAKAEDTGAVYALLCAYLDAVRGHDIALTLPARLTHMPIRGMRDVARRHAAARELYMRSATEHHRLDPLLMEIAEVCAATVHRLQCLEVSLECAA
jgi:hypothetical protein